MARCEGVLYEEKCRLGLYDAETDPEKTGLIGVEFSPLTTSQGHLPDKQAAARPAMADVVAEYLRRAGVEEGDWVAVNASASFPGFILASLCAVESMKANAQIAFSYGASMYGGTDPEFTFPVMLDLLNHPSAALALGVLLHDAGKPATQTRTDRIRFNDHDKAGAIIAREVCERLRLPRRDTERVVWLVAQHMRFQHIPKMRESKRKRTIRADGFEELKELCRIDCLASHGNLDTVVWVENYQAQLPPESLRPEPLVQGNDLIALGYPPGPLFSKILKHVEDLQLDGRLTTPDEARAFILAHWPRERQARDEGS